MCLLHTCLPELRLDTALRTERANAARQVRLKRRQEHRLPSVLGSGAGENTINKKTETAHQYFLHKPHLTLQWDVACQGSEE